MKKQNVFLCLGFVVMCALALAMTACASNTPQQTGTGPGSAAPPPKPAPKIERIRVDYQGAAIGSDVPEWVEAATNMDIETIKKIPRFKGKVPIVAVNTGQNLDILRSWVNNFDVQAQISRMISNYVEAEFGGKQKGNKNSPENINFVEEMVTTFSNAKISGLGKEMDYWIKLRTKDHDKGTETEGYFYYVVYSISEEDLNYQVAQSLGKVKTKTKEQEEIKQDVEAAMRQTRFNSIQQASN